jgi:hypothetical protein
MNLIVHPKVDYEILQDFIKATISGEENYISELMVIPQDRIGFSGANVYVYYYTTVDIPNYSRPYFFKIAQGKKAETLEQEAHAFKRYVKGRISNAQFIEGPYRTKINGVEYVCIASEVVGSFSTENPVSDFNNFQVITLDEWLKQRDFYFPHDSEKFYQKTKHSIDYTFTKILQPWIALNKSRTFSWLDEYQQNLRWSKSIKRLESLLNESKNFNYIDLLGNKCINPLLYINDFILKQNYTANVRVVHGDLHLKNMVL